MEHMAQGISIRDALVGLYWPRSSPQLVSAADSLASAWLRLDVTSVPYGLRVGCGGQSEVVTAFLTQRETPLTRRFFHVGGLSGYQGITELQEDLAKLVAGVRKAGLRSHCVTCILPCFDMLEPGRNKAPTDRAWQSSRVAIARRAFHQQLGVVVDTWNNNVKPYKKAQPLAEYLATYDSGLVMYPIVDQVNG